MAKRANPVANFFGRTFDRIVPGNNWNPNAAPGSRWNATPGQYLGAAGGIVGNALMPGAGTLIRQGVHGATTGQGPLGFLQRNVPFNGNPVTPMTFDPGTPVFGPAGGLTPANVAPVDPIVFNGQFGLNQIPVPPELQNQAPAGTNTSKPQSVFLGPSIPGGMASLSGIAAQNGGARGARSWGGNGLTGEAARSFMQGIHNAPLTIFTGHGGQKQA